MDRRYILFLVYLLAGLFFKSYQELIDVRINNHLCWWVSVVSVYENVFSFDYDWCSYLRVEIQ